MTMSFWTFFFIVFKNRKTIVFIFILYSYNIDYQIEIVVGAIDALIHYIEHSLLFYRSHSLSCISLTRSFSTLLHVERRHVCRLALHERSRAHIRLFARICPPFSRFFNSEWRLIDFRRRLETYERWREKE
jgi:hypothetical protein